jgi:hypothetical protein
MNDIALMSSKHYKVEYSKECIEKGVRRCTRCNTVKPLEDFYLFTRQVKKETYYSSACKICSRKNRKLGKLKEKIKYGEVAIKDKRKKNFDRNKEALTNPYLKNTLSLTMTISMKRMGYNITYAEMNNCITDEMLVAKKALMQIKTIIKELNHEIK